MSVTAEMVARLRRMVAETDDSNGYTFDVLVDAIGEYPLVDEQGEVPYTWDTATSPPTQDVNEDWVATYDLHAAAGRIWEEKATAWVDKYDFSADGGQFVRHQAYDQMMQMARHHNARRAPRNRLLVASPKPSAVSLTTLVNQVEELP